MLKNVDIMRRCRRLRDHLFFLLILLLVGLSCCEAHESCCKFKIGEQKNHEPEFVEDPHDRPPPIWEGQPRYVDDPNDTKPDYWDDEDDGEWAPISILNPRYSWQPRKIPNPAYSPPPTFWDKLKVEIQAALPWVTLGVLITGILSMVSLPAETLELWLRPAGGNLSVLSTLLRHTSAAFLGLATPLCSCGSLPLCAALLKQDVPFSSVMVFLTASQSAGIDSAAITYGLLGASAMFGRLLGAVALSLAVGFACHSREVDTKKGLRKSEKASLASDSRKGLSFGRLLSTCLETSTEIYPTVLLGLALSTAALHYLPSITSYMSSTGEISNHESFLMRFLLLGAAVPLQLCEHTSVALASAIQNAGGSPGLAFAFLLSAPAINLSTILWMMRSQQLLSVGVIVLTLCATALALSFIIDGWRLDLLAGESTNEMASLPNWFIESSPYICGGMMLAGLQQKFQRTRKKWGVLETCSTDDCCACDGSSPTKTKIE